MKNQRPDFLHDRLLRSPGVALALAAALLLALAARQGSPGGGDATRERTIVAGQGRSGLVAVLLEAWYTPTFEPTLTPTPTSTATPTFTATPTITLTPTAVAPSATAPPASAPVTIAPTLTPLPTATLQPTATPEPTPTPRPLPTPDGIVRTLSVPILMYHYISTPPEGAGAIRRDLSVSPEVFAEHLRYLSEAGYTTISLSDLVLALTIGAPLPERPIVLTFDDGYRDAYEHAYPLLQARGFTGTFFVVTSFVDQGNPNHLTWEQVAEMSAGGMSMESHGYTHDEMEARDREFLIWQMLGSKEAIEARTGKPVRFFCYPSGYYDEHAMQVLHELDYWAATTIVFGQEHTSESLFDLHRVRIHGDYTVERVAALLEALRAP